MDVPSTWRERLSAATAKTLSLRGSTYSFYGLEVQDGGFQSQIRKEGNEGDRDVEKERRMGNRDTEA